MANFWRFVMAVGRHWKELAGGATVIILIGTAEALSEWDFPSFWYAVLLIALFFYASFLAWKDEQDKVVALEQKQSDQYPKLQVEIHQITVGSIEATLQIGGPLKPLTYAAPLVSVLNLGAPTVLNWFHLAVQRVDGTVAIGQPTTPPTELVLSDGAGHNAIIPFGESLQEQAWNQIQRGGMAKGRLFFIFDGHSISAISGLGVTFKLSLRDAWYPATPEYVATVEWKPSEKPYTLAGKGAKAHMLPADDNPTPPQSKNGQEKPS